MVNGNMNYGSFNDNDAFSDNAERYFYYRRSLPLWPLLFVVTLAALSVISRLSCPPFEDVNDTRIQTMLMLSRDANNYEDHLMNAYPRRPFIIRNNFNVTIPVLGFPSASLARLSNKADQSLANEIIRHAVEDLLISYFDVAPEYGDGVAQLRLGPALKPYREHIFLAAKTMYRTANESAVDLANTLNALKTDHLDLYQFHSISTDDDVDTILGAGGAMETFIQAKRNGIIRAIGFSAHSEPMAIRMIESGLVDTCMFPINFAAYYYGGVGQKVLDAALNNNVGLIALKSGARGRLNSETGNPVHVPDSFKHIPEWKRKEMMEYPVKTSKIHPTEWYMPEDDVEMLHKLVLWSLNQRGVSAVLPPASLDLLDGISDMLRGKVQVPSLQNGDFELMMATYANVVPIFHNQSIAGTKVST
jgi:aryl-alcohol dehydrogenase-like predicted oxidoreductase